MGLVKVAIHSLTTQQQRFRNYNCAHSQMNRPIPLVFAILCVVTLVNAQDDYDKAWENYKSKFNKTYRSTDEQVRKRIFVTTHIQIEEHNSKESGYEMGYNQFSDMTQREKNRYLGADVALAGPETRRLPAYNPEIPQDRQLPASLDYRSNSCLQPVKSQGSCGSCWAFTAIASLEFSKCRKSGLRLRLSEQHLVDCDTANRGCNGGWYVTAWNYLKKGSASSGSYSYTGRASTCRYTTTMDVAKVSTFGYVASKNQTAMRSALNTYGPLAVAINVVSSFYSYRSGVYSDPTCTGTSGAVNHGVNVVGYGTLNGVDYWIVRNSWGSNWGASGYVLMRRGVNMCNIEMYPAYVVSA